MTASFAITALIGLVILAIIFVIALRRMKD
jgi:hypothetical protein